MSDATVVDRDKRGNWAPKYLEQLPAPMVWPPNPLKILKWFFGWGGYLWPWNAIYLGIALLAYFFMTPLKLSPRWRPSRRGGSGPSSPATWG